MEDSDWHCARCGQHFRSFDVPTLTAERELVHIDGCPDELEDCIISAVRAMDAENPNRICNYCFNPRSSEFCQRSHPLQRPPVLVDLMSSVVELLLDARRRIEPHLIAASSGAASELDYYVPADRTEETHGKRYM